MKRQVTLRGLNVQGIFVNGTVQINYENGYSHDLNFRCSLATFENDERFKELIVQLEEEREALIECDEAFQLLDKYSTRVFEI